MTLIELAKPRNDRSVYVNPDQVRYVEGSGENVRIVFDDDQAVIVAGPIDRVTDALQST